MLFLLQTSNSAGGVLYRNLPYSVFENFNFVSFIIYFRFIMSLAEVRHRVVFSF